MKPLKIAIDGRMFNQSGIGRYIRNLIGCLQIIDKKNEYFILHLAGDFEKLVYRNNFHKVLANFRWYGVTEQIKMPHILQSIKPDLVHFPHFNVPIFYKGSYVVTIHDLIHQNFSMKRATTHGSLVYKLKKIGYKNIFKTGLKNSKKILVPSNFVKQQLTTDWKIDETKVAVTPEAVDDNIVALMGEISNLKVQKVLHKFQIKTPYIFYVGNAHPHKNVEGLIKVFRKLKQRFTDLSLVLSGNDHYFWQKIRNEFQDESIIFTGFISDEELVILYKNAEVFVLPSLEEGFGIPVLEAMACCAPVISSNLGSLPEVGGDAASYFNPRDLTQMAQKVSEVLTSKNLRQELKEKGLKRYKNFSWISLARKTLEVYKECV